jgi:hypothetical protein
MVVTGFIGAGSHNSVTEADENKPGEHEFRGDRAPKSSSSGKGAFSHSHPTYLGMEEARQLLAEMNVRVTARQIKRSSDMDLAGRRKLPWFIDPIEGRLKIERNALLSAYFNRQVEAERNCVLGLRGASPASVTLQTS